MRIDLKKFPFLSISFKKAKKNDEKEEFKEVSVSLNMDTVPDCAQLPRPSMKRPKPSTSREKEKKLTLTHAAHETGIEKDQDETDDDFVETDFNIVHSSDTIDEEYAEIESSLFSSLLGKDYSTIIELPEDNYENNEITVACGMKFTLMYYQRKTIIH